MWEPGTLIIRKHGSVHQRVEIGDRLIVVSRDGTSVLLRNLENNQEWWCSERFQKQYQKPDNTNPFRRTVGGI